MSTSNKTTLIIGAGLFTLGFAASYLLNTPDAEPEKHQGRMAPAVTEDTHIEFNSGFDDLQQAYNAGTTWQQQDITDIEASNETEHTGESSTQQPLPEQEYGLSDYTEKKLQERLDREHAYYLESTAGQPFTGAQPTIENAMTLPPKEAYRDQIDQDAILQRAREDGYITD